MTFRTDDPDEILEMAMEWDRNQAQSDIMGYIGMKVLADRDDPGRYMMVADFGVVDPEVSASEEAQRNNERPETQASAARLAAIVTGEIEWHHYDELYRTDPIAQLYARRDRED
jgi:hypothetical protein